MPTTISDFRAAMGRAGFSITFTRAADILADAGVTDRATNHVIASAPDLLAERDALRAQVDELAAALRSALHAIDNARDTDYDYMCEKVAQNAGRTMQTAIENYNASDALAKSARAALAKREQLIRIAV